MTEHPNTAQLRQIRDEVWNLTASPLYNFRQENQYYPVLGEGSHTATILFTGEAPGKNEAEQGRPFCGRSGKVLDDWIASLGLARQDVYITNIVKDRPPENRDPNAAELRIYAPFLLRQIDIIQPQVICPVGRFSMEFIFEQFKVPVKDPRITKVQGQIFDGEASYGVIKVVPLLHPSYFLRNQRFEDALDAVSVLKQFVDGT